MESKEALEKLKGVAIYEENTNMCSDLGDCCNFKGELFEVYEEEIDAIDKDLDRLEKQDKAIEIIKRYAVNDGWSNGWVIKFWEMNSKELEKVKEVFENDKCKFSK